MKDGARIVVRPAVAGEGEGLAALAGQLGYPTLASDAEKRLSLLVEQEGHAVFVAEVEGRDRIAGWIHLMPRLLLYAPRFVEIGGLVVDEKYRRKGVGRALVGAGEQWAREQGYSGTVVNSNAVRKEAHVFYPGVGYRNVKTQRVYVKELRTLQEESV